MSDHHFDEDHNYYTQGHRQSQIPDYDVDHDPSTTSFQTLPAFAYRQSREYSPRHSREYSPRQSREYSPKRPKVSTSFDQYASTNSSSNRDHSHFDSTPDPHEFYRQYRDSFIRQGGSVYGSLDDGNDGLAGDMAATRSNQRPIPISTRHNGYAPSPLSARWKDIGDSHSTPSPLSDRTSPGMSARRGPYSAVQLPRGRQSSLQTLVSKFERTTDEIPPMPRKPTSRSSSSTNSPSTSTAPNSFRSRATRDSTQHNSHAVKHRRPSGEEKEGINSHAGRRKHVVAHPSQPNKSPRSHRISAIATSPFATQSLTDLNPGSSDASRRPLFGEVVGENQSLANLGYGIPGYRQRRGSEGSMHHPNPMFHEDPHMMMKVSPSSPTAWYMGVTPSLEGIDLDKPVPARPPGMHRRSRSDFGTGSFAIAPLASSAGKSITILSPAVEQPSPSPSPTTTTKRSSQSRIPISSRRISITSDSGGSDPSTRASSGMGNYVSNRKAHKKGPSTIPIPADPVTPEPAARVATPRKSPRHRNVSPHRQPSPRLDVYISETAPLKSPPLRSSRPRQSVASATTSASRARAAANSTEKPSTSKPNQPKKLPEMVTVDFAARRKRIQQAFTKSMIETEQEEEKKRMSLLQDAQLLKSLDGTLNDRDVAKTPETVVEHNFDEQEEQNQEREVFSTPAEEASQNDRGLTIDTIKAQSRAEVAVVALNQEDSPTLGIAKFGDSGKDQLDDSDDGPDSAVTTGTAETFFDNEPQETSTHVEHPAPTEHNIQQDLESSNALLESPDGLRKPNALSGSDQDDGESIQIMLGETPITEQGRRFDTFDRQYGRGEIERQAQPESPVDVASPTITHNTNHASTSSSSTYYAQPWSPESASSAISAQTLDSESYNTINRVLDAYHDPSLMSPENISEIQRRLFSQSPGLARAGGWDTKKVTQLYLQNLRSSKTPDPSAVPKPLNVHSSTEDNALRSGTPSAKSETTRDKVERSATSSEIGAERHEPTGQDHAAESLNVPPGTLNLQRASLNNPDDWLNTSPSMLDWIHRQAYDSPTDGSDEKSSESIREWDVDATDPSTSMAKGERSLLPDIPRGGLGIIDVNVDLPSDARLQASHAHPNAVQYRSSPLRSMQKTSPASPIRKPVPGQSSLNNLFPPPVKPASPKRSMESTINMQTDGQLSEAEDVMTPRADDDSIITDRLSAEGPSASTESIAKPSTIAPDVQKRLTRRRHVLKEMIDTESSFGQDMTVVVDIYKGTSNVILNSSDDVKTLFGNAHEIVAFSTAFLDSLKSSAKTVYTLPKAKRWRSKRDSNATTESGNTDDQAPASGVDLNDEEKDRLTSVGTAFLEHLADMERVYTDYLKNHDSANQKLQQLQKSQKVQIWLKECQTYANDLTTAWDLDSLLVKPVQRLLKYGLFLKELTEVTPENHPDFVNIDTAAREIKGVSMRINDIKKRADYMEQVIGGRKNRKESEGRIALTKRFNLRPEKFKPQLGIADLFQDREYNAISDKFGSHFFQLQVVMRDVEMYVEEAQSWVSKFNDVVLAIEAYMDVKQTTYPEVESKWRRFRHSMREIQMTALTDHVCAVRKSVIEPMTTLLKLHDGPQKLMDKRKKRTVDYAKYKASKDRGEKADKKTMELGEQFLAINDTLKDELPKLFSLTGKLVEACLNNFVQLQLQWQSVWRRKLIQAIELNEVPRSFAIIFEDFSGDFRYTEAQVLLLSICNGSLLTDTTNFTQYLTPQTTLTDDDSSRRPSLANDEPRSRTLSNTTTEVVRSRGPSSSSGLSPMIPSPDLGRPTDGLGLGPHLTANGYQPGTGRRIRASSTASNRSPITPEMPVTWRTQSNGLPSMAHSNRPSTSTGRYEGPTPARPGEGQRLSSDSRLRSEAMGPREHTTPNHQQDPTNRYSGVFSSAMPMSDTPRGQSPDEEGGRGDQDFNVLFLAASVYEFNIDRARREAGYPYLTYVAGEIFDVIGEKGELWLAKNQDDRTNQVGWIWNKHFAKLAS